MKRFFIGMAAVALAVLLVACGVAPGIETRTGTLRIVVDDRVSSKAVMPPVSLDASYYSVHGTGSGAAAGQSFDIDITVAQGSAEVNLTPGVWTVLATVWNDEDPPVAVGEGSDSKTIQVGVDATMVLACLPYTGEGTIVVDVSWVPNVLAVPTAEAELKSFAWNDGNPMGTVTAIPMDTPVGTATQGTLDLEQGWYTGALRLLDNGVLSAGVVRAVRIMYDTTTTWTEFLTVSQLAGIVTLDVSYYPGPPLTLTTNTPYTEPPDLIALVLVYGEEIKTFTVTNVDNDAGTDVAYGWYLDGVLTALSTTPSYPLAAGDFTIGARHYLSVVCFQSDGRRAGSAVWGIRNDGYSANEVLVQWTGVAGHDYSVMWEKSGGGSGTTPIVGVTGGNEFLQVFAAAGEYKIRVYDFTATIFEWWQESNEAGADWIVMPATGEPMILDFGTLDF